MVKSKFQVFLVLKYLKINYYIVKKKDKTKLKKSNFFENKSNFFLNYNRKLK